MSNPQQPFSSNNDSAILLVDTSESFGPGASAPLPPPSLPVQSNSNLDGYQILNQVQQQLTFMPSQNENVFISGNMLEPNRTDFSSTSSQPSAPSFVMDGGGRGGGGENPSNLRLDFVQPSSAEPERSNANASNKYSIWQWNYYAKYFDLSSDVLTRRILWSFMPLTGGNKGKFVL